MPRQHKFKAEIVFFIDIISLHIAGNEKLCYWCKIQNNAKSSEEGLKNMA